MRNKWKRWSWEWTLRLAGMIGIAHETLIAKTDRPTLLLLFAAMIGLPSFLKADERRNGNGKKGSSS